MKRFEKCQVLIVTIDGPAGSGKSTVAKTVAARTGLLYLDTGKLYRAIAFFLSGAGIPPVDNEILEEALLRLDLKLRDGRVSIHDADVTESLHTPEVDRIVSLYAALPSVRKSLLSLQRAQAGPPGLVVDGRDMGSVVFPEAVLKIFLTADARERARRRFLEQSARGERVDFEEVLSVVMSRDKTDSTRSVAPLVIPEKARVIDTTTKTAYEVIEEIVLMVETERKRLGETNENHVV